MTITDSLRIHAGDEPGPRAGGEFVLYWLQTSMRAWDNPALNFAVEQANRLRLPLLVYQGLRSDYPWANDRIHTFILESVVDLRAGFETRDIPYAFYLESGPRDESRAGPSPLVALADRAALVVTDFFPTFIVPRQIRALRRKTETPVVAVDGCTLVPLKLLDREFSTARAIRPRLLEALPHYPGAQRRTRAAAPDRTSLRSGMARGGHHPGAGGPMRDRPCRTAITDHSRGAAGRPRPT
jgi:deoxyribodipyrimidine photo-lyase